MTSIPLTLSHLEDYNRRQHRCAYKWNSQLKRASGTQKWIGQPANFKQRKIQKDGALWSFSVVNAESCRGNKTIQSWHALSAFPTFYVASIPFYHTKDCSHSAACGASLFGHCETIWIPVSFVRTRLSAANLHRFRCAPNFFFLLLWRM